MTQEHKELLLKDLSARLPYGVKCQFEDTIETIKEIWFCEDEGWQVDGEKTSTCIHAVKPYLLPFYSMSEEQKREWRALMISDSYGILYPTIKSFDYLYKNHVDIRGLINIELAIDATNKNVY
jgi:hypothetical protein